MEHPTLIEEWINVAAEKAAKEVEATLLAKAIVIGNRIGIQQHAIKTILRILIVRFKISEIRQEIVKGKLDRLMDVTQLETVEEQALQTHTFPEFNLYLDELLQTHANTGSGQ